METPEHASVARRLTAYGSHPVDPEVVGDHLSALAQAAPRAGVSHRRMRPLLAGSLLFGAVMGGTGLAAALPGSLPEQASSVARSALQAVNLADADKPGRSEAAKDKDGDGTADQKGVERFTAGCTVGDPPKPFTGNHGQYVKAHPDLAGTPDVNERQVAAQSDCGKPLSSIGLPDDATGSGKGDDAGTKPDDPGANGKGHGNGAGAKPEEPGQPDDAGKPVETGRPDSPGKSEESHPPSTAENEQGSEHRTTSPGGSGDAGKAGDNRPEGLGPPTSGS